MARIPAYAQMTILPGTDLPPDPSKEQKQNTSTLNQDLMTSLYSSSLEEQEIKGEEINEQEIKGEEINEQEIKGEEINEQEIKGEEE